MRRALFPLVLAAAAFLVSCPARDDLSHRMTIVNNSSQEVAQVGLGYTGVKSPLLDLVLDVSVPAGARKTVDLILDPSTDYYVLQLDDPALAKRIIWDESASTAYVRLSGGGSSTCTVADSAAACFAGENAVNPYSFSWP